MRNTVLVVVLSLFVWNAEANSSNIFGKWRMNGSNQKGSAQSINVTEYIAVLDIQSNQIVSSVICKKGNAAIQNSIAVQAQVTKNTIEILEAKKQELNQRGIDCVNWTEKKLWSYSVQNSNQLILRTGNSMVVFQRAY